MKLEFIRLTLAMTKINIAVAAMPECGKELLLEACDIMIPLCLRFPENGEYRHVYDAAVTQLKSWI